MFSRDRALRALGLVAVFGSLSAMSSAQWQENPPMFPAPFYDGLNPVTFNLPAVQIVASNFHMQTLGGRIPFPGSGAQADSFFDVFLDVDLFVSGNTGHGTAGGQGHAHITNAVGSSFFDTEMLSLNLSGTSPFGPFMIRESPTLASLGRASVQPSGNTFMIDSFFDVFFELSIDGGQTWGPSSSGSMRLNGVVPEPASMAVLGLGALAMIRRRRR
jgi:hypothetical protein